MTNSLRHGFDYLTDHYAAICLFLSLPILTFTGVGDTAVTGTLGLILCITGLMQRCRRVDPYVLIPLILYNLASMASSYFVYHNAVDGYASTQIIFPVIYLLMACADEAELSLVRRLCSLWAGIAAVSGIIFYVYAAAVLNRGGRLNGLLGNPNAAGIFFVIGWLLLQDIHTKQHDALPAESPNVPQRTARSADRSHTGNNGRHASQAAPVSKMGNLLTASLAFTEPFLLTALALTLSMGSFLSMAAGIFVLLYGKVKSTSLQETLPCACRLLAKASLGIGTGILLYLAASWTDFPKICLVLFPYVMAMALCWKKFELFLNEYPRVAAFISAAGIFVAAAAVIIRPSAFATFSERLDMMRSGISYLMVNPFFGVGPYRWRLLDLQDGGTYFNTWHIHNSLIHVGVELGLMAMALLGFVILRFFKKEKSLSQRAAFMAFFFHNMMDTSFFYIGITAFSLLATGDPDNRGKKIPDAVIRLLFGAFALYFVYVLFYGIAL